jgi:hypothetical protein
MLGRRALTCAVLVMTAALGVPMSRAATISAPTRDEAARWGGVSTGTCSTPAGDPGADAGIGGGKTGQDAWARALGIAHPAPRYVTDFLSGGGATDTWASMEDTSFFSDCWAPYTAQHPGLPLIGTPQEMSYAIVMLPRGVPGLSLAAGATGAYNSHWATIAQNLIAAGEGDSVIRLGWELDADHGPTSADRDPAAWAGYWRQIVTTMRAQSGADFTFAWNVNNGYNHQVDAGGHVLPQAFDARTAWPGADFVDLVTDDIYDLDYSSEGYPIPAGASATEVAARQQHALTTILHAPQWSADFWAAFAASQGKPFGVSEWGLALGSPNGGGDDPGFIDGMVQWFAQHDVAYASYFDELGTLDSRIFSGAPASADRLKADLTSLTSTGSLGL